MKFVSGKELPSSSATEDFNEKIQSTKSMLLSYRQSCSKKIDSLKMFVEAEHEQAKREIERKKAKQQTELKQKLEDERNFALFGQPSKCRSFVTYVLTALCPILYFSAVPNTCDEDLDSNPCCRSYSRK